MTEMKSVFLNGIKVGEVPATGSHMGDAAAGAALIEARGLKPKEQTEERKMFLQAVAFTNTANLLWERYFKDGITTESQIGVSPLVVNSALAIELYLKCLGRAFGASLRGHNLIALYASLPDAARAAIEQHRKKLAASQGVSATIPEILAELKNTFVDWRYIYEKPISNVIKLPEMIFAMRVLHETIAATGKADFIQ